MKLSTAFSVYWTNFVLSSSAVIVLGALQHRRVRIEVDRLAPPASAPIAAGAAAAPATVECEAANLQRLTDLLGYLDGRVSRRRAGDRFADQFAVDIDELVPFVKKGGHGVFEPDRIVA